MPKRDTSGNNRLPPNIGVQNVPFNETVDSRMRTLKARTGITPNILARLGFCLSLEEPGIPTDPFQNEKAARPIKRETLLGQHETIFTCLLRTWVLDNFPSVTISQKQFDDLFVAHMNRGFELVSARMRSLADLQNIVPDAQNA